MNEFDRHKEITENFLKKEEARDASAEKGKETPTIPDPGKEKIKGTVVTAEEKAKDDEKILDTPEDELDEEQKARKEEILKVKKPEKPEEKKPDDQDRLNKRFGELTGEIKDLKADKSQDREKITELEKQLGEVNEKLNPPKEDVEKKAEGERVKKYLTDDKDKPREEKREMSKEDLEEWLLEDNVAATEWLMERSLRRSGEKRAFRGSQEAKKAVDKLTAEMEKSQKRVTIKHPELDIEERTKELKEDDKTDKEIHKILYKENEKFRLMYDIMKENPKKYWVNNGPELLAEEMEKRLGKKPSGKKEFTDEELEKIKQDARNDALETEKERIASLDEGNGSSRDKETKPKSNLSPEMEKKKKEILRRSGVSEEEFNASRERRKKIGV